MRPCLIESRACRIDERGGRGEQGSKRNVTMIFMEDKRFKLTRAMASFAISKKLYGNLRIVEAITNVDIALYLYASTFRKFLSRDRRRYNV